MGTHLRRDDKQEQLTFFFTVDFAVNAFITRVRCSGGMFMYFGRDLVFRLIYIIFYII